MRSALGDRLRGVLPPLATPFEKGEVAPARLRANIEKLRSTGLSGFVVLGSNGETPLLRDDEQLKLVESARAAVPPEQILMVGAGRESTVQTIRFVNQVAALGADCVLVITPSFYASSMTGEVLRRYYLDVAESARVPVLLYVVPQFTGGVVLDADTVQKLAQHPNIAGLKDSSGQMERFAKYLNRTQAGFAPFAGNANTFYEALNLGAAGGILAVANILPEACVRLMRRFEEGEREEARRVQAAISPVASAVTTGHGIAGLKAAMEMLGYFAGEPRRPLLPVDASTRERIAALLKEAQEALAGLA